MTFAWPPALVLLLAVPALVVAYRRRVRRRLARRAELARLGLVPTEQSPRGGRRHAGPLLLLGALTLLLTAMARPEATVVEPRREGTVILAFDTSNSMAAEDLRPSRMEAAQAAARRFVERQPPSVRIGVVAFGDSALITQQPTDRRDEVLAAIGRLAPQGGTSLGRGIAASLTAIAGRPVTVDEEMLADPGATDLGYHGSAVVVLLSDGEDTSDVDPLAIAELSSTAGVRVHPVGVGSPEGTVVTIEGFQVATALDEALLREVAEITDGRYHPADDEAALSEVYASIDLELTLAERRVEVTALFAAAAGLLLLAGATVSLLRTGRLV